MKRAKVKYYNDYLVLCMPDGEIIPEQTNLKIKNQSGDRKLATVTVTLLADISAIGEPDKRIVEDNLRRIESLEAEIKTLKEEAEKSYKSAVFWEKLHNNENKELKKYKQINYVLLILFILASIKIYSVL